MKTYAVISTTHKEGFLKYGKENIHTFIKFWPKEIKYHLFLEDFEYNEFDKERVVVYDLHKTIPDLFKLKQRNKNIKSTNLTKNKKNDSYMFDYVRFANKSYVQFFSIENINVDYIIWLDIDVKTFNYVTYDFLNKICPDDSLVSYLKRKDLYTETGFLAFNRKNPKIKEYLKIAKNIYDNDLIYKIDYFKKGYTDCHVFDYSLENIIKTFGTKVTNLNVRNEKAHPFINSELGKYMDHFKGPERKEKKSSRKSEITNKEIANIDYWKNK